MKAFKNYIKESNNSNEISLTDSFVTLEGLNEDEISRLNNIDGMQISEYYGDDCCCGTCCDIKTCEPVTKTIPAPGEYKGEDVYFYSQSEVIGCLRISPKCDILRRINAQYSGNIHTLYGETALKNIEPLYFQGDYAYIEKGNSGNETYNIVPQWNKKLYEYVKKITTDNKLRYPVVVNNGNKEIQVYALKSILTNYDDEIKKKSIKKSLEETAKLLGKLENDENISYAQVLDVAINGTFSYQYLITFIIQPENFVMTDEEITKVIKEQNPQ